MHRPHRTGAPRGTSASYSAITPRGPFRHTDGQVTAPGVSIQTYDLAGRPAYGSYELPEDA
ncbi:hypothetical protein [Streptomyces sp. NBC_01635]|uniref:hypothetical protein n=1 Tax=Streptomyces sp. NBC_01635 TaxID=2975904 RepID=UPI00386A9726